MARMASTIERALGSSSSPLINDLSIFNLALICEQEGQTMKAMSYWKAYLKLDNASSWAEIARRQMDRLKQAAFVGPR